MSGFPQGNFTITNADTGRTIQAILGKTTEYRDYQLGNTFIDKVTDKPRLVMGDSATLLEAAWYYDASKNSAGTVYAALISVAVDVKLNIGKSAIGITNIPARTRNLELAEIEYLIPSSWTGSSVQWHEFASDIYHFLLRIPVPESWSEPNDTWLPRLLNARPYACSWDDAVCSAIEGLAVPPQWSGESKAELLDTAMFYDNVFRSGRPEGGKTGMIGAYTVKGWNGMNKRWQANGTQIWSIGGDGSGGPTEAESYLTDIGGTLVGLPKGETGQTWIFASV